MASVTIKGGSVFGEGTSVGAYPATQIGPEGGPPSGSATTTATVTNDVLAFSGLADNTEYVAYAASPNRYKHFRTDPPVPVVGGSGIVSDRFRRDHIGKAFSTQAGGSPLSVVADPVVGVTVPVDATKQYAFSPAIIDAIDGRMVVAWIQGASHTTHDWEIHAAYSFTGDEGDWHHIGIVVPVSGSENYHDPCLTRAPGDSKIYLTYWRERNSDGLNTGLGIRVSTDNGLTFGPEIQAMTTGYVASSPPRLFRDGLWRWPVYKPFSGGYVPALLVSSDGPTGTWTDLNQSIMPTAVTSAEWDVLDIASNNWVGFVRQGSSQSVIVQSTDQGTTWNNVLLTTPSATFSGWNRLSRGTDGRIYGFARVGSSTHMVQCLDPANPLTAANWREPGQRESTYILGDDVNATKEVGRFAPVLVRGVLYGVVHHEIDTSDTQGRIEFCALNERLLMGGYSQVATSEAVASATDVQLTTPDSVKIRTAGGRFRIFWGARSSQPTGATISNYGIAVYKDGALFQANYLQASVGGVTRTPSSGTTSAYFDSREAVVELDAGIHNFDLRYQVTTTSTPRNFQNRVFEVVPF